MANRFWVGGTAQWDATAGTKWATISGGVGGASVPTLTDDVFFDALSLGATVTAVGVGVANCRNLDCTGFTGTLTFTNSVSVGGPVAKLASGMTINGAGGLNMLFSGAQVLTSAGKTLPSLTLSHGAGGSTTLADALSVSGTITLATGAFATANFAVTCGVFSSSNTSTRSITLGTSTVTCTASTTTSWNLSTNTNLTLSAASSTIVLSGSNPAFAGGASPSTVYGTLTITGADQFIYLTSSSTFTNLTRTGTANKTAQFIYGTSGSLTVTGTLTFTGNSAANRLLVLSSAPGTVRTITAAAVSFNNVDFMDIIGAGAATWSGTSIGDAGGNTNITFTAAVTRYWVGGAGNWSDTARWSASSGGASGASVPLPQDTVRIDAASLTSAQTITADMPRMCRDLDMTGNNDAGSFASTGISVAVFGSLTLAGGYSAANLVFVFSGRGSHTITSAGSVLGAASFLCGGTGSYSLSDALSVVGASGIAMSGVTFTTNNFNVTTTVWSQSGALTANVTLGTSTVSLTATSGTLWNSAGTQTLSAASSTIVISSASASSRTFAGNGKTYGTITYTVAASTGALILTGANTIGTLNVRGGARTLTLPSATVTTVGNWHVFGAAGALVTVNSSTPASAATLTKTGDTLVTDYLSVQDITVNGISPRYAGRHSTDVSGNSGWTFADPLIGFGVSL